ncbi:hypothetical protein AB0A77_15515 [Streptomyces varsoviensis]|uniref:hypothetical protein n=1 Tax=Streptomyces varsoviensis TaxID=67373 RepID=UPI0033C3A9BC
MDRISELADLVRQLGPDGARAQMTAEMEAEMAAETERPSAAATTEDELTRRYGDAPDIEVEPA